MNITVNLAMSCAIARCARTVRTADLAGYDCPYEVRMHKEGECIQPFRTSTSASSSGKNMAIVRSERQWDWISGDPL